MKSRRQILNGYQLTSNKTYIPIGKDELKDVFLKVPERPLRVKIEDITVEGTKDDFKYGLNSLKSMPPFNIEETEHNPLWHIGKLWILYQECKRDHGFWTPPTAKLTIQKTVHFHPGSSRMKAILLNKFYDLDFVVWCKPEDLPEGKEMEYDDWYETFKSDNEEEYPNFYAFVEKHHADYMEGYILENHISYSTKEFNPSGKKLYELIKRGTTEWKKENPTNDDNAIFLEMTEETSILENDILKWTINR